MCLCGYRYECLNVVIVSLEVQGERMRHRVRLEEAGERVDRDGLPHRRLWPPAERHPSEAVRAATMIQKPGRVELLHADGAVGLARRMRPEGPSREQTSPS